MSALHDALQAHSRAMPDQLALVHPLAEWTWRGLAERVASEGLDPSLPQLVEVHDVPAILPTLLAAERDGACLIPLQCDLAPDEHARRCAVEVVPFPGVVVFTSGTTGEARGVRLPFERLLTSARLVIEATALEAGDAWLSALPLSHVGGIGVVVRCVLAGATMLLQDRFEPQESSRLLFARATHASFVARSLERTLDVPTHARGSRLKAVMVGGGPTAAPLLARARSLGVPALGTYGMTEAGSTVTLQGLDALTPSSAGLPLCGVQLRIADDGTIEVRTPARMLGYLGEPDASPSDWLCTRDVGRLLPDGRLVVLDRRSDLIVTGGENVSPDRVEQIIASDPAVLDVAVLGRPDPSWGQVVVAVVNLRGSYDLSLLAARVNTALAPHERPKRWVVSMDPLPRDALGKLRRGSLRALISVPFPTGR